LRISEDNLTGFCTVEFEIVVLHPELNIVEFRRSRCFIAGRYYQICVISLFTEEIAWSDGFKVASINNIGSGSNLLVLV